MRFQKTISGMILCLAALLPACAAGAEEQSPALEISGFGDVQYAAPYDSAGGAFALGQAEIDISASLTKTISASAALAYNGDEGTFESGEFFVDIHLFGGDDNHFRPVRGITSSGILAGQFDIPFGIDWEVYASIDRKLVTAPLAVESAHGLWNDTGVQVYAANDWINGVVYAVNGFGYDDTVNIRYASGGRIGIKPVSILQIGGSYAGSVRSGGDADMSLAGGDARLDWRGLTLKGEYITRKTGLASGPETVSFGYYGEAMYQTGPAFAIVRHDSWTEGGAGEITRTSLGAGWVVADGCETRLEYQLRPDEEEDMTYLQLVVGF